ncbi:redoxin domain-containing protein [Arthrobacter sp. MSA 4-2]|uniref:redoxin domain-containing protein n=1 Tax=Arthrobacter sp. MSA 4-2 TaxID=2794349 RepID=UPI0018E8BA25|nr:redoxin domain-containing protein [Arthrobacter sp. MSA 4-2]MBJ2121506.1 redoxin domain-containing protein [Arthrobacter sp. MSA 4-2]
MNATPKSPGGNPLGGLLRKIAHGLEDDGAELPDEGRLAPFDGATGWLNSEPLTPQGLRGRVVLVNFWTYTCVNWLRTLPYVRAWASQYEEAGLTVVGVHTPEFGFEGDLDNVVAHTRNLGVEFPVAVDSDYRVWSAFANRYWPAVYIADAEGRLRYHHFGEGEYARIETVIQQLLLDAGARDVDLGLVSVEPRGLEVAADWQSLRSPETYLGYAQSSGFVSEGVAADKPYEYTAASSLPLNSWDLRGNWRVARHAAASNSTGARIAFTFHARDLNLVMGPLVRGAEIHFVVSLDGRIVGDAHGTDVDADGRGTIRDQNAYQLIRQSGQISNRRFEIEFLEAGAEAYCFTFG